MKTRLFAGKAVIAALGAIALAGCAAPQLPPTTEEARRIEIDAEISDSLSLATNAQRELAMTMDAGVQRQATTRQRLMTDRVSYDFYGDVEKIVGDIASKYGFELRISGKRPPDHVNVNVFVQKMPVLDVLRFVGTTAGYWLDIRITPGVIELNYKSTSA